MCVRQRYLPTPYPAVNELLDRVRTGAQAILGTGFAGMYVHGSLAWGDFDPGRSDVDFLVVTETPLPPELALRLQAMHGEIAASDMDWAIHHEGSYIPRQALRRHDPADCTFPAVRVDGTFGLDVHGSEWIVQRHIIRERGIVVAGPPAQSLIDPVSAAGLREAVRTLLRQWWVSRLSDPSWFDSSEYQAYAVLTMCRALYTLEMGAIASKPVAARWLLEREGARWAGLIATAQSWRRGKEIDCLPDALELIRYTVARSESA